jgi:hypothetical protein
MTTDTWGYAKKLTDAMQEAVNEDGDSQGVVTAFVAVLEVMDGDGKKLVTYRGPNAEAIPVWVARGMLREVTDNPDWFVGEDDD